MKFGIFVPPIHKTGINPTLALQRTLELVEHWERLGYDEVWIGEHHSSGTELIASPELMIAAAAQRTKRIRLGTGVVSLPYHHPFHVAERIMQLDHLTMGRAMFGLGPGQIPADAWMLGIDPVLLRSRLEEGLEVVLALLRGETVTRRTDWFTCDEAVLQLAPYSDLELSVVGTISPSGPKLAGRHGLGLLSLAATDPLGTEKLAEHWDIMAEEGARRGHAIDRSRWRLMGPIYVAETVEQAKRDCRYGLRFVYEYLTHVSPSTIPIPDDPDDLADVLNETGRAVIGTPDMAAAQIERLVQHSGGFGTYLFFGADLAPYREMRRSYELFAEEVMPRFTGALDPVRASWDRVAAAAPGALDAVLAAREAAAKQWQSERSAAAPEPTG